jgi:hypothetical protein
VRFDELVERATSVAVVRAIESKSVWEEGRIMTYTRVRVEDPIAGASLGTEAWIVTRGGIVGDVGQQVDGEPVLQTNESSLVFLLSRNSTSQWVVERGQGQYGIQKDVAGEWRLKLSRRGITLTPKVENLGTQRPIPLHFRQLAASYLGGRPLHEAKRDIQEAWRLIHASK